MSALPDSLIRKKAALDALRPLPAAVVRQLEDWLTVELTWSSNAIEGNTLTRQETAVVLEKGITVRGKALRDHLEATDHRDALEFVRTVATETRAVTEADIRQIHSLTVGKSNPGIAGRYAETARLIAGSDTRFPPPAAIPGEMAAFIKWIARSETGPKQAFEAHRRLVQIHPFADGNGRTARLLMNLLLLRAGWPPVAVLPEDRPDYLETLEAAHVKGDMEPYNALMASLLERMLDRYLELAQAP